MAQEKWLVDGEKTIDLEIVNSLKISLIAGRIDVIGHDEPHTRIEVHSVSGRDLKISIDGDHLEIDHPQLRWDNFVEVFGTFRGKARADVSVRVPRDVALSFGVVSAEALIAGLRADATLSTVSGSIVVDDHVGDLQLSAVNGEVQVQSLAGDLSARSVSGDITAAGSIGRFSADTVSGSVFADLTGVPDRARVNTVSGAVTARLALGMPAQYRINTVSGRLQLDDAHIAGVRGSYESRYGDLDDRWLEFRANTVSGDISVLHAEAAQ